MSYSYSVTSRVNLEECDSRLVMIMGVVLQHVDHSILEGHRDRKRQQLLLHQGLSKVDWPYSKHNQNPSRAVDTMAYPIDWNNHQRNALFAGFVLGIAQQLGYELIWGGDWDYNFDPTDNWMDAAHFELRIPTLI